MYSRICVTTRSEVDEPCEKLRRGYDVGGDGKLSVLLRHQYRIHPQPVENGPRQTLREAHPDADVLPGEHTEDLFRIAAHIHCLISLKTAAFLFDSFNVCHLVHTVMLDESRIRVISCKATGQKTCYDRSATEYYQKLERRFSNKASFSRCDTIPK